MGVRCGGLLRTCGQEVDIVVLGHRRLRRTHTYTPRHAWRQPPAGAGARRVAARTVCSPVRGLYGRPPNPSGSTLLAVHAMVRAAERRVRQRRFQNFIEPVQY